VRLFYSYSPFNPITALSDQIQKLITEHGSSSILRDHLSMFKDQGVILEKQLDSLSSDNETLKSAKQKLEQENQELRSEIEQHKQPADYEMKLGCVTFHGDETLYCLSAFSINRENCQLSAKAGDFATVRLANLKFQQGSHICSLKKYIWASGLSSCNSKMYW